MQDAPSVSARTPRAQLGPGSWFHALAVPLAGWELARGKPSGFARFAPEVLIHWRHFRLLSGQISQLSDLCFLLSWKLEKALFDSFSERMVSFFKNCYRCFSACGFRRGQQPGSRQSSSVSAGQGQICWLHSAWPGGPQPNVAAVMSKRLNISKLWMGEVKSQYWLCGLA